MVVVVVVVVVVVIVVKMLLTSLESKWFPFEIFPRRLLTVRGASSLLRTQTRMPATVATLRSVSTAVRQQHLQEVLLCPVSWVISPALLFSWVAWLLTEPRLEDLSEEAV